MVASKVRVNDSLCVEVRERKKVRKGEREDVFE